MLKTSYENFFINFANKTRLRIIVLLKNKALSVGEISKELDEEQSAVSHNLKKLASCRILNVERKGKERIYSLNKDTVLPMLRIVDKHVCSFCKGSCEKRCR